MSKRALIVHGFEIFSKTHPLVKSLVRKGYAVEYPMYFTYGEKFDIKKIAKKIVNDNKKVDVLIGISLGGLIAGRLLKSMKPKKVILIASGPKFKPTDKRIKLLFKLPEFIVYFLIKIAKNVKPKTQNMKIVFNQQLLKLLTTKCLFSLYKFVKNDDVTQQLNKYKRKLFAISGSKDELMPINNLKTLKECKVIDVEAQHHNVINKKSLKQFEAII